MGLPFKALIDATGIPAIPDLLIIVLPGVGHSRTIWLVELLIQQNLPFGL